MCVWFSHGASPGVVVGPQGDNSWPPMMPQGPLDDLIAVRRLYTVYTDGRPAGCNTCVYSERSRHSRLLLINDNSNIHSMVCCSCNCLQCEKVTQSTIATGAVHHSNRSSGCRTRTVCSGCRTRTVCRNDEHMNCCAVSNHYMLSVVEA